MNYQEILSHFTYDDSTDIRNRAAVAEAGDYRENRDIINEIVLWKMNRRPQVTEELIDAIFLLKEIKTPLQILTDEKTAKVVEKLLQTKGMQLPMASTVLHFYYPEIFPIIDQRAYRELYAMDYPKTMTKIPMLTELYLKYIKDCWEYQQEKCPEIAFSQIDKVLYQLDKEKGNKVIYNPLELSEELGMDKFKVMELLNSLNEKKIISITVEKENNKSEEYISLELLYKKIANILIDKKEDKTLDNSDIFSIFEKEFGRTISSMECQIIKGWIDDGFSHELIMEALKEAIYNGVTSLRYIEKILYEWRKKGYKNKKDIQEAKEKYRESKKETKDYFFYDWINDD